MGLKVILQHIIFPSPQICTEEKMYFRRSESAVYQWTEDAIYLNQFAKVDFDTYFNGFSAEKWFKYTQIEEVSIVIKIRGCFRVTLMQKRRHDRGLVEVKYLSEHICGIAGKQGEYSFNFNSCNTSGMFCFSLLAMEDDCVFYGGSYNGCINPKCVNKVKLGLVICTYKREKMLCKNLKAIREKLLDNRESELFKQLEVFVSDNGKTLNGVELSNDKIHVFQNKNTGGAGGFTRGIVEVLRTTKSSRITHVILTDDDIILDPEVIFTTYTMLCILKSEYKLAFIGGAMLRLDRQYIQSESGAVWNGGNIVSLKSGLDLRECEACLFNEVEEKTDYNAWWYCAMPIGVITEQNLPLPLFIRGDDIEYGLRSMSSLILLNRLCVWHEPFENKYSSAFCYYIFRNLMINNALHMKKFKCLKVAKKLIAAVFRELSYYRFKDAKLIIKGVEDFLKGTARLNSKDGEKLHGELALDGEELEYIEKLDIPFSYPPYEASLNQKGGGRFGRFFRIITLNGLFFPASKDVIVPLTRPRPVNFFRAKRALNYDSNTQKGFVTKKSIRSAVGCVLKLSVTVLKLILSSKKVALDYKINSPELMKIDFWNEYLDL